MLLRRPLYSGVGGWKIVEFSITKHCCVNCSCWGTRLCFFLSLQMALRVTRRGRDLDMVKAVKELFGEALFHLPSSSVVVERLHANTQLNCPAFRSGRSYDVIQQNSYIMSAFLEHSEIRKHVENETLGIVKRGIGKLVSARTISSTLPSKPVTNAAPKSSMPSDSVEPFVKKWHGSAGYLEFVLFSMIL